MSEKATITQAALTRALKAAAAAGLPVARFEVMPTGRVVVYTADEPGAPKPLNDWDDE